MVITQTNQKVVQPPTQKPFAIDALAGSIGKAVIEAYLGYFGYEIYPFGYENHYANVTRFIKRDPLKTTLTKIRAMPDLLVFDRVSGESELVEVKTSSSKNSKEFWIGKDRFDNYNTHWPEAILVVYMLSFGKVHCSRISELKISREGFLPHSTDPGYYLDLSLFSDLLQYFSKMDRSKYDDLSKKIQKTLKKFDIPEHDKFSPCHLVN
jgi:hypothetical protein